MRPISRRFILALAALVLPGCGSGNNSRMPSGTGSSFVKPIMDKWIDVYFGEHDGDINYQSSGSTAGIKQMIEQAVDFGCTDTFMTAEQLELARQHGGEVVHLPLVIGAIVPAYNLKGIDQPINFSGEVLADIFLGNIRKWNDPALQKLNATVTLPDLDIAVVHRTEGSGSTFLFTKYLHTVSTAWQQSGIGYGATVNWKCGTGEQGNPGVAGFISQTEGSIGYLELFFALLKRHEISFGAVRNRAGKFLRASLANVAKAADNALKDEKRITPELDIDLLDAPGEESYPITGTTWAVLYAQQQQHIGAALVDFFRWATHEGQNYNESMNYARLPAALVKCIDEKLQTIRR